MSREPHSPLISGRPTPPREGTAIAGRYEFLRELGGGGMAVVYEVRDTRRGVRLALKRLHTHVRPEREQRARALFEHEYYTLSQLRHPRIVSAFDYGLDDVGPYYTMELLDGGDLQRLSPVAPERLCQIAADVCSALCLLHSRRLLHRDVSPRNVRCTSDGRAKLIDFGAMTHMGPSKELIGTPSYTAPELVNLQLLDARTDLFALGATLYYALTGRHAYPASDFASLSLAWREGPVRPSELTAGIPDALDALVLDLLQLEPADRPRSAAEVLDRLAALDARPAVEGERLDAHAYLATPAFVGREAELSRVRAKLQRTCAKRGSVVLVEAAPGLGRSRLLDAVVLNAKLLGLTVLRAYANDTAPEDYVALRAVLLQLQVALPDGRLAALVEELPALARIVPELCRVEGSLSQLADPAALRPRVQQALRQLMRTISVEFPLLLALDDLPLLDEPSIAAFALLARQVDDVGVQIVATAPAGYVGLGESAFRVYAGLGSRVTLAPFQAGQAHAMLASLFGDANGLDELVSQLMARTHGNPRDLMRLAQHLVDRNVVTYRAGTWTLPQRIDESELPDSLTQVLRATIDVLDDATRGLAAAFAMCPDQSFSFAECRLLATHLDPQRLSAQINGLVTIDVLRALDTRYGLGDRAYAPMLLGTLNKAQTEAAHARLAAAFAARGDEAFRVAQHLLRAGRNAEALDAFVAYAVESQALTNQSPDAFYKLLRTLPEDWLASYEEALARGQQLKRPRAQLYALRSRLAGIVGTAGLRSTSHVAELISDLATAAGLWDYAAQDPQLTAAERIHAALAAAQARHAATPEAERICDPLTAIQALGRATITALGMYAPLLDVAGVRALPALEPLAVLSPALSVVAQLRDGVYARLTGRFDRALAIYNGILERTSQPDRAGLDVSHHRFTRMTVTGVIALIEASMGLASSLERADALERDPLFQVQALQVRALYRLWQGDCLRAEREQREVDVARIESGARYNQETAHLVWQVTAHAGMEDLTRLRRSVEQIKRTGEGLPGWRPLISYATAAYQRARGDVRRALVELEDTLATVTAGEHLLWPLLAAAHVRTLDDARKSARAVEVGLNYCKQAEEAGIGFSALYLELPLAVAEAKLQMPEAKPRAERVIERFRSLGTTGLSLALAYEARIRVAIAEADTDGYLRFVTQYDQDCSNTGGEALATKLHRLKREAEAAHLIASQAAESKLAQQSIKSKLLTCSGAAERASVMLAVLAASCGGSEGFLYLNREGGPAWVASVGARAAPPEALDRLARDLIAAQAALDMDATADVAPEETQTDWSTLGEASYQPVVLSHISDTGAHVVTGLLVLLVTTDQRIVRSDFATQMSRVAAEIGDCVPLSMLRDEVESEV